MPGVGDFLGFGGGDSPTPFVRRFDFSTPAFELNSAFVPQEGRFATNLVRRGSAPQSAFSSRFPRILGDIDELRKTVKPGFSQLRGARIGAVRAREEAALSDIRETVAQRRLQGSSLARNLELQARRTFAQEEANQVAASFIDELNANVGILTQESNTIAGALDRELAELGVVSQSGTALAGLVNQSILANSQLAAQEAQGAGAFLGQLLRTGVQAFSQGGPFGAPLPAPERTFVSFDPFEQPI